MTKIYRVTGNKYAYLYPILKAVSKTAKSLNIDFIVIGATARDFLIEYVFDLDLNYRATRDIDFIMMIDNWKDYDEMKYILVNKYSFTDHPQKQRILYNELPVDIIPYGKIAKDNKIAWSPNGDVEMNVTGFEILFEKNFRCEYNNVVFKIPKWKGF